MESTHEEDEAFNDIERQAKQRKEAVLQVLHDENERLGLYKDAYGDSHSKERLLAEINVLTELVQDVYLTAEEAMEYGICDQIATLNR